jgi:hypothetical protein
MDLFYYDYEFVFEDDFNQQVFDAYPIPDLDNTLIIIVQDITNKLKALITAQHGIRVISSFGTHDDQRLKITVINTSWVAASE